MTKEEFAVLVSAMRTYYGKENLLPNNQAMALWYAQLQDIPYKVAEAALNKWVATERWSPTIADLRRLSAEILQSETRDWGDAWQSVMKAISRYGYNRQSEAMEYLDDVTREAVRRIGWYDICMSETPAIQRANFRDIYNNLQERNEKDRLIPPNVSLLIAEVRQNLIEGE